MRNRYVMESRHVGLKLALERLAVWWTQAPQEERFRLVGASIAGSPQAPPLKDLQLAIVLAESEADKGEIDQG